MSELPDLGQIAKLELDIDLRIGHIWESAVGQEEWELELVMAYCRWGYGQGYMDCLRDADPALWLEEHGYRVPKRAMPCE